MSGLLAILGNMQLWASTLSLSVPLVLPALGGTFSERTGVVNIAMEGIMLIGAFFAVFFSSLTMNPWVGLLGAVVAGGIMAVIFAWAAIRLRSDQVIIGMAVNIFASGLTAYLLNTIFGFGGTPVNTPMLPHLNWPWLGRIPVLGPLLNDQSILVYITLLLVVAGHFFLFHTRLGLRMRAVGENPEAADTAGINVYRIRYLGVLISGFLSALAGAYLSIGVLNSFEVDMTNGRGYIALAAMIFGRWTPFGSFGAALLFGFASALSMPLQSSVAAKNLVQMLPYVVTILALIGVGGKSVAPAADGVPYEAEK